MMRDYPTTWRYWLALANSLTDTAMLTLLRHFSDPETILNASVNNRAEKSGLSVNQVAITPDWPAIDQTCNTLMQLQVQLLTWTDKHYPPRLREITRPPPLLFILGNQEILSRPQLAIVGSRAPSRGGIEAARQLAMELGKAGLVITSGLALGIDKVCHEGALLAPTPTIAVLGSGIDIIYPNKHCDLAKKIVQEQGAVISEFPLSTPPRGAHFPQRNRIISGLSLGTLVVEATRRSGSLITARYALEQNREVFAVPGSIHNPLAAGCNQLIKQGAKLVETAQDVLEELPMLLNHLNPNATTSTEVDKQQAITHHLDLEAQKILICLTFDTITPIDIIIEHTGLSAETVSASLLMMELNNVIVSAPGGYLRKK
jgi:DNA processing protein